MAAQSNPPASFGYTWGFADNSRSDGQIVEISPNINYTVSDNVSFIHSNIFNAISFYFCFCFAFRFELKSLVCSRFRQNWPFRVFISLSEQTKRNHFFPF